MKNNKVRVRFAPSPTGSLHIGGIRTALYNYLFAKKMGGDFILRIEDTDMSRYVPGAEEYILNSLKWLGISPNEGVVDIGREVGDFGPYKQSNRKDIYWNYVNKLIDNGWAYYAFDTPEELDDMRERLKKANVVSPQYNSITRMQMKNSLTLSDDDVSSRIAAGDPYVIRLKVPKNEEVKIMDIIRGLVVVKTSTMDDKVLMKSDGMPTYHLANVVDDHLMGITHVIRGEEWLPSAPTHVLLYKAFGWLDTMPEFAHLPLLLKPIGDGKLSKRDGEAFGFPVFPLSWKDDEGGKVIDGFKELGYLPDALINFLALLGWSPNDNKEVLSVGEMVDQFELGRVGKSGARFDINKAKWFNKEYLGKLPKDVLVDAIKNDINNAGLTYPEDKLDKLVDVFKDRAYFLSDLFTLSKFIFSDDYDLDIKFLKVISNHEITSLGIDFSHYLDLIDDFNPDVVKSNLDGLISERGLKKGPVMKVIRLSLSGATSGPELIDIIELIGSKSSANRLRTKLNLIQKISDSSTSVI